MADRQPAALGHICPNDGRIVTAIGFVGDETYEGRCSDCGTVYQLAAPETAPRVQVPVVAPVVGAPAITSRAVGLPERYVAAGESAEVPQIAVPPLEQSPVNVDPVSGAPIATPVQAVPTELPEERVADEVPVTKPTPQLAVAPQPAPPTEDHAREEPA